MPYVKSTSVTEDGRFVIDDMYYSRRHHPEKTKNVEKRIEKHQGTSVCQAKINLRNRIDELVKLILNNFRKDDLWVTITIANRISYEEYKIGYEKMMRKLRSFYKKRGIELKYIAVHENVDGKGRLHGHMLIPSLGVDIPATKEVLVNIWRLGGCHIEPYKGKFGDAQRLASYIAKEKTVMSMLDEQAKLIAAYKKTGETDIERLMSIKREIESLRSNICTSKNLIRTKAKKVIVTRADTFSDKIRARKGYHVVPEFSYSWFTEEGYKHKRVVYEADDAEQFNTR